MAQPCIYIGTYAGDVAATAAIPTAVGTDNPGIIYYDSAAAVPKLWDGAAWQVMGGGSGGPVGLVNMIYVDANGPVTETGSYTYPFHSIAGALAVAVNGDVICIAPGTYAILADLVPAVNVTLVSAGTSRGTTTISRGAGTPAFTIGVGVAVTLENLTIDGSIDVAGTGNALTVRACRITGMLDVQSTCDVTTVVLVDDSRIVGDVTDVFALLIGDPAAKVTLHKSYLKGVADVAVRYADVGGVINNDLRIAHCTIMHGSLGDANPMSTSAGAPVYRSHHTAWNSDPEELAAFTNDIPVAQRFDTFTEEADY
jgi:hypothetical protein